MLSVVFEKFELVCVFFPIFFFSLSLLVGKRSTLTKIWGLHPPVSVVSMDLNQEILKASKNNLSS